MKVVIVVACAFLAVAVAAPPSEREVEPVKILRIENEHQPDGGYRVSFESDDGTKREETAELVEVPNEEGKLVKVLVVRGFYSYRGPNGEVETIEYSADQDGYHPKGESIPKNPVPSRR